MAKIIEESENLKLERMATTVTSRGDEYVINIDECVKAAADLFSDFDNEIRMGWSLQQGWYEEAFKTLRRRATAHTSSAANRTAE